MNPFHITRSVRSANRLRHIAKVLAQHGFGHVVARVNLGRYLPVWMLRRQLVPDHGAATVPTIGRRLVDVCIELGPTFVKFGQMLSTRVDLLPEDVIGELRSLQDDVPPFDSVEAHRIIERELGKPVRELFSSLSEVPIASGSIGQVYEARLAGGTEVVVKVRRPGIDDTIRMDLQILAWLAQSIEAVIPESRAYRPTMLVAELEQTLTRELDFINEASATARFERAFQGDEGIRIPRVYWEHTSPCVLTLQRLGGVNTERIVNGTMKGDVSIDKSLAAKRLVDAYLRQVFELGFFNADPHPGNILIESPATVGLIDFGQTGNISDEMMTQLVVMAYAAVAREVDVVVDSLADLGALGPNTDRRNLTRALQLVLDKYYGLPLKRLDLTTLLTEFTDVVRRHDVVIPREVVVLIKAVGMVASTASRLDPDLNILELLQQRLKQTLRQRMSPKSLSRELGVVGWHLLSVARSAPGQVRDLMRNLASGGWRMHVEHENLDRLTQELDRSSNRIAFSVVIAAIIIGSSVVISANAEIQVIGVRVQTFGVIGYMVAGVLGLGLSWAIFRSGRLH